ncbi:Type 3 secretion system secretin [Caulobacter sp. NIBR1757]|nr:Type 3 secretion system secretin [Caulobacter sp. NIBR1757]
MANEVLGNRLGLSFTIDPEVRGALSFSVQGRLSREQLLAAFEATLAANDIALVRTASGYLITPRAKAKTMAQAPSLQESRGATGYRIEAITVTYATPSEVVKAISTLSPSGLVVHVDDKLGFVLVGGTSREIAAVRDIIAIFDRSDLQGSRIRYYELRSAPAEIVAAETQRLIQASGTSGLTVVPLKRMNSLVVIGRSPAALDAAFAWIDRLDAPSREERNSLWLYKARNTSAENLSKSLSAVLGTGALEIAEGPAAPAAQDLPPVGPIAAASAVSDVKVSFDIDSNTLIVAAPASRWVQIQRILSELDAQPDQVLIEAKILEVTLSNDFRFGVDWSTIASGGALTITSTGNSNGSVGPTFPGLAITYISDDARAAITALSSKTNVEVVSSPKILALNNRASTLQIGDQVPVAVQSSRSSNSNDAPVVVSTEYRDTGVILKVTPRISGDKTVLIEISQEVSAVARTTSSGIDSPTIQQRKIEGNLIVQEGQTVALGGLISSSKSVGSSGPPLVQDIPLLGELFKRTTNDGKRTELIILISATIVRSPTDADNLLADLTAGMSQMRARGLLDER